MELTTSFQKIGTSSIITFGQAKGYLELWAKYNSQNIADNSTNYTLETRLVVTVGYIYDGTGVSYAVTSDGISVSKSLGIGSYTSRVISTDTGTTGHNADGSKTINATSSIWFSAWGKGISVSGSATLPNIPRQATLTDASNFNDEQNPVINYSNPVGNAVTSLQACISWTGNADIPYRDISKTGSSYTFNLTFDERNALRNACSTSNSLTVMFYVTTVISGVTYYSTLQRTMTIVNANPNFTNFEYKDTNSKVTAVTGNNQILVANLSNLEAVISSTNKMILTKGATGNRYAFSIDGKNASANYSMTESVSVSLGAFGTAGTKRLEVRAFDSRNNSSMVYKDITVIPYSAPAIYITPERLNNFEEQTTIKVKGAYSKVTINSIDKNAISSIKYRIREVGGTWSALNTMTFTVDADKGEYTCEDVYVNLDNTKSFEIEVQVIDVFDTYTSSKPVGVGKPIFFISDNLQCVGVNCMPPADAKPGSIWFDNGDGVVKEVLDYDIIDEW